MTTRLVSRGAALAGRVLAALVFGFVGAESRAADTLRGQVTRCGEAVAGVKVFAFVTVEEGFKTDLKPCTVITEKVPVGSDTTDGGGRYSFTFARPVADEDACRFVLSFDVEDAKLGNCQKREMDFELFDAEGSRAAVLRRVLPFESSLPRILLYLSTFRRGDSNASGTVDISDALNTLGTLLLGTGAIPCADAADANDDGRVDISDAVATLSVLFLGSNLIPPPGTDNCSPDGTEDALPFCAYSETLCPASTNKGSDPF